MTVSELIDLLKAYNLPDAEVVIDIQETIAFVRQVDIDVLQEGGRVVRISDMTW